MGVTLAAMTLVGGVAHGQMALPEPMALAQQAPATTAAPVAGDTAAKPADKAAATDAAASGKKVPKAAVITLGERGDKDMVGKYMTEHQLIEALPKLKEELGDDGTGIVVFRITSGGGALFEIQKLSDIIHNVYKKHFRVVAWIDSAISAAAMTSHCIEEIYFTSQGNYGACTGWSGALVAMKGRGLEEVLQMMREISARGGYDPKIMRSMQIMEPLSATVDENGHVEFYQDAVSGKILLNPEGRILTLNAETAKRIHFSRGTADTLDQLTKLMGYQELNWVGKHEKGYIWPISKGEKFSMEYRNKVYDAERLFNADVTNYQQQVAAAEGAAKEERGKFVNRALATLRKLKQAVKNNPNFARFQYGMEPEEFEEWYKEQERQLKNLLK